MLTSAATTTIVPVTDPERASSFYAERLGLTSEGVGPGGMPIFHLGGGGLLSLQNNPGAQSGNTLLSFEVSDINREMRELEQRGITFEDYDLPELKTVNHVAVVGAEKAAWFTDTEGNILCLHEVMLEA